MGSSVPDSLQNQKVETDLPSEAADTTASQTAAASSDVNALKRNDASIGELMPRGDLASAVRGLAAANSRSLGGEGSALFLTVAAQMLADERNQLREDLARERSRANDLTTKLGEKTTECAVAQAQVVSLRETTTLRLAISALGGTLGGALLGAVQSAYTQAAWLGISIAVVGVTLIAFGIGFGVWRRN